MIISKNDGRGQLRVTSRTRRMLKQPLCTSNGCSDSEEGEPSTEYLLTHRGEEAGPSDLVIPTLSTNSRQKGGR